MFVQSTRTGVRWLTGAVICTTLAGTFGVSSPAAALPNAESGSAAAAALPLDTGSMTTINQIIGADKAWAAGYTGAGVDIALIDTGIAPLPGIQTAKVLNGPDLSFDGQTLPEAQRMIDSFGHGTHLGGIIAGRDASASLTDPTKFVGVAPDARLVNVKVGAYDGATDVSQVIAAVNWVVQHRKDSGMNIRVINLSYGTLSTQTSLFDPLAFAVEKAWKAGIVVVVAGGNDGLATTTSLSNPAYDPLVIAVGASDPLGTLATADDSIPAFATHGNKQRSVDVVAPGVGVLSLNVPGSFIDQTFYGAAGPRLVRGSGTSQSAAVVSGAAALVLQRYPNATPDQVKKHLMATASPIAKGLKEHKGTGVVNVGKAVTTGLPIALPQVAISTGLGTLEAARGPDHLSIGGNVLAGERDIFGNAWNGSLLAKQAGLGTSWTGGVWNGSRWSGDVWSSAGWTNVKWDRASWAGTDFADASLSTAVWDGSRWSGSRWSGSRWSGSRWSGSRWSGAGWS